ncbi:MAG TPA: LLM class flavin-dependent oxidoreductase, partial [Acidimicrobiia bacterium]|nr:LLM class flavin-dependent oxidoreductase [Acidimicrobiia bacterium]
RVLAMKEIWTKDEAEFHGDHVDFGPIWAWPKPAQRPHPPVLVAGNGPNTLARVLEYGDGWIPIPGRGAVTLGEGTAKLREMAAEQGRGPIPVTVFGARPDPEVIAHYAEAGVDRVLFALPPVPAPEALEHLDNYTKIAETQCS